MYKVIEVKNSLDTLINNDMKEINTAFKSVVLEMRNLAVANCPHDTGALRSDIASHQFEINENTYEIGSSLDYASFVHDGTHKMASRPFITYAIDQLEDQIQVMIARALGGD